MRIWILLITIGYAIAGFAENYENNWFVLVDTSRYIFNYRHFSNVLALYQQLRKFGIKDDRIILLAPLTYA
jgi:glycosylphosphatidylinositol transamidase (GPIT) subunit GPI8